MSFRLPRNILFDLDGTLLDSLPGIEYSVRTAFTECGLPQRHDNLRELIGPPIRTILARAGEIEDSVQLDALEKAFRGSYDRDGWSKTVCFPDTSRILRLMHERQHRLFVVSNKPRHIALQILESEDILHLFETIQTRDSRLPAYSGKEEIIKALLAQHQIAPEDCLMVGDTMEDAKAAVATEIKFAYMAYGYGELYEKDSVPIACKLDSFLQFLPMMAKELVCD